MLKRLTLVLLVVSMVMPLTACRFIAPALEDISGGGCCGGCDDGCTTKSDLIVRQCDVVLFVRNVDHDCHNFRVAQAYAICGSGYLTRPW